MKKTWLMVTFAYLVLTALAGVVMRLAPFLEIEQIVAYEHLLHAHSHLAILGWAYGALFLLLMHAFDCDGKGIRLLFVSSQLVAGAMFIAFAIQGYSAVSIALSTVHIFLSYGFAYRMWRWLGISASGLPTAAHGAAKASLIALVISSFGPWGLAALSASGRKGSELYDMAIYFYLHFQYNGWLTLGLAAVLIRYGEKIGIGSFLRGIGKWITVYFWMLFPGYFLSILWAHVGWAGYGAAVLSAVVQLVAVAAVWGLFYHKREELRSGMTGWAWRLLVMGGWCLLIKTTMELGLLVPALSDLIYNYRSVVIGYLHLTLLGFISFALIAFVMANGFIKAQKSVVRLGSWLFVAGFAVNELVLFLDGLSGWILSRSMPYANELLLAAAVLMLGGSFGWLRGITGDDRPLTS